MYPRMADMIGVATHVTHKKMMVVLRNTGAPSARADATTEKQAN